MGGGWGSSDVQEAFNLIETDQDYGTAAWHGHEGPIPVNRYLDVEATEFDAAVQQLLRERHVGWVPDLNLPGATGFGRMPMNSVGGRRVTTVDLLKNADLRLELRADATAAKVVFSGTGASGIGLDDGSAIEGDTVVLAAGVYGSPCVLMRSGVGPPDLLDGLGIPVHVDLRGVGANLCDHPAVSLDLGYRGVQRPGPLLHTFATLTSPYAADGDGPDLAFWSSDPEGDPAEGWLEVMLLRPQARGRVAVASTDPAQQPRIWLPVPTDEDVLLLSHGVRQALDLLATSALQSICTEPVEGVPQEPDRLAAWVRAEAYSVPHTVGTCAMGASPERGAVVDAAGQVHGVEGLYVADASVLPGPPTGFPHLVALMIARRIADGIVARSVL